MKAVRLVILTCLITFSHQTWAIQSPVDFLDGVATRVIKSLERKKGRLTPNVAYSIVNSIMLPHVDVTGMSRSVLGRDAWNKASGGERSRFSREFTKLVVRTYAKAISKYTDEKVHFYPIRGNWQSQSRVEVKSLVKRSNGPNIPINYRLIRKGSRWKVYDLSVEGVSLVATYRSQFASQVRNGGINNVIKQLQQKNAR